MLQVCICLLIYVWCFFLYLISCTNSDSTRKTIFWQSSTRNGQLSPKQCLWFCQWATHFVLLYLVYWHSFDHEKVSAMAFVLTKTPISLEFDMLAVFCKLFLKYIKISWGSIDQKVTNWWIKKIHLAKSCLFLAKCIFFIHQFVTIWSRDPQ